MDKEIKFANKKIEDYFMSFEFVKILLDVAEITELVVSSSGHIPCAYKYKGLEIYYLPEDGFYKIAGRKICLIPTCIEELDSDVFRFKRQFDLPPQ